MEDPIKKKAQERIHQAQAEGRPIMDKINKAVVIARRRAELEKERAERRAREAGQGEQGETKTEGYMGKMDSLGKKMGKLSRKLTKRVD